MIEAELFDGTVLEFPDGTSPEVIQRKVKELTAQRHTTPPPAEQPAAPEKGWLDTIMGYGDSALHGAAYLGQEAARGVTNVVGSPVDLINASPMLLNLLPGEQGMTPIAENPVGGGQWLWDALTAPRDVVNEAAGLPQEDLQPRGTIERAAGRVANEVGAAAVPVLGALRAARTMGVEGARQMGGPIGQFVESAAVNPGKFAGKEATYAAGAGAGAGILREAVSDGDPTTTTPAEASADVIGAIMGYGATGLGHGIVNTSKDALALMTGKGSSAVRDAVAGELGRVAGAPSTPGGVMDTSGLATALRGGTERVEQTIPGFVPSTGDVLQNPNVQALEYSRQSGPNSGLYTQRRADNAQAVNRAIDQNAPTATPGAFRETLDARRADALGQADAAVSDAQAAFDKAASNLQTAMSGEARGQTLRAALDEALSAAREVERQAWSAVDGEVDPTDLAGRFGAVTDNLTQAERVAVSDAGSVLAIPEQLAGDPTVAAAAGVQPVRVGEITSLRSSLTTAIRQAEAAGDPNKARILGKYVDAVDASLDAVPGLSDQLKNARAVSLDLNNRFTRRGTPVADALATTRSGGNVVPDSQIASRFVKPNEGQASNIDRVLNEVGPTQAAADARSALRDQILADVQSKGLLDKPEDLKAYLGQYGQVFDKFPELRSELGNAASLRTALGEAEAARKGTTAAIEKGPVGKYLAYGDERAVDAMAGVANAKDPAAAADELIAFAGQDPAALEGARAAFWQLMEREAKSTGTSTRMAGTGGDQPWRAASLYNFLNTPKYRAVAERLYADNPEHLNNLDAIANELRGLDMRVTAKAPNSSGTPQSLAGSGVLPSAETLGAYSFAYQRGQIGLPYIGLRIASTVFRRATLAGKTAQFQELLDKALLNPELAAALAKENNPADIAALSRAAKATLGVRAAWIDEVLGSDQQSEDDALKGRIMEGAP